MIRRTPTWSRSSAGLDGTAMYFSRSPIPFDRDRRGGPDAGVLRHVGLYVYRRGFPRSVCRAPRGAAGAMRAARTAPGPSARVHDRRGDGARGPGGDRHAGAVRGVCPAGEGAAVRVGGTTYFAGEVALFLEATQANRRRALWPGRPVSAPRMSRSPARPWGRRSSRAIRQPRGPCGIRDRSTGARGPRSPCRCCGAPACR